MPKRVDIPRPYIKAVLPPAQTEQVDISAYVAPQQQEFIYDAHRYISLTRLASDAGISLSHLSRILTRQRKPSITVAIRLAKVMGVTLDKLVVGYLGL